MSAPYMPFYVADYLADTGHLTTVEHGAYLLLICHYWRTGGLPDDDEKLSRIARLNVEQWLNVRSTLVQLFISPWKHKRIDAELEKDRQREMRARLAGIASGLSRKGNRRSTGVEHPLNGRSPQVELARNHSDSDSYKKEDFLGNEKKIPLQIDRDTPNGEAWDAYWRATRGQPPPWVNGKWYFPTPMPPPLHKEAAE